MYIVDKNQSTLSRFFAHSRAFGATPLCPFLLIPNFGGEGEIRTLDPVSRMPVFETGAFDHSATSPVVIKYHFLRFSAIVACIGPIV